MILWIVMPKLIAYWETAYLRNKLNFLIKIGWCKWMLYVIAFKISLMNNAPITARKCEWNDTSFIKTLVMIVMMTKMRARTSHYH